ncbi:glycosyltransferase family 2 protein [Tamlana fucoidanivorans]|uniref:Glycosyltransferase family 2 protein n=1 Tax=Allotamlana fucoidanivorans TaxID=2583814 RepID=A0A5C4SSH2_9FLAO|nr:glycosyltransferase family 2 protein [Tamlana fucoidanivorans]TNJ46561.1 glycosyltransferase family 2 protein [Tamlana fucoidanivorans]
MNIAVVILNWNGKKLLEQFLPSVVNYSQEADIYIADNASTDDSIAYIKQTFPSVSIIQNKENGGYAKGYNDALKQINGDIFCLLNSDIEVTKNWLKPILSRFKNHKETDIIQPKILDYKNKQYFEYAGAAGGFIDQYGYPYCRGRIFNTVEADYGQYDDNSQIFWASGACLFIKKRVFEHLNGFDESFFAHMEEIDLCWRAINKGYHIWYIHDSVVYHVGGATLNDQNPKKTFLNFRNSLFTLTKNARGLLFKLILIRLILDGVAGLKFLFNLKPKHTLAIIKAHFSFYSHFPKLLKQRHTVKNKKKYYNRTSIIVDYFVNNKRKYSDL